MADRPLGVTILCILSWIGAIILIGLGAVGAIASLAIGSGVGLVLSLTILVVGILLFFVTFALWQLKMWAWWLVIILNIIQIVLGIGSAISQGSTGSIIGIIVPIIIVIYLWTLSIKLDNLGHSCPSPSIEETGRFLFVLLTVKR